MEYKSWKVSALQLLTRVLIVYVFVLTIVVDYVDAEKEPREESVESAPVPSASAVSV